MKSGVNTTRSEADPKKIPKPKSRANTPVSIGFRPDSEGSVVANWGGGLKGTGVPFTLTKFKTDHPIKTKASEKTGKAKMIESGMGNIFVMPNNLSTCKAITTKENINRP